MKTIVVGVDGSDGSNAALRWTVEQARRGGGLRVVALKAWQPVIPASGVWWSEYDIPHDLHDGALATLEASIDEVCGSSTDVEIERCVVRGSAHGALMDAARTADALVVGSRGFGGLKGTLLGSVGRQLVAHAPCPTVIVPLPGSRRATTEADPSRIVVGLDGSPNSLAAFEWAVEWATATEGHIRAVYVERCPSSPARPHTRAGTVVLGDPHCAAQLELASFVLSSELSVDVPLELHAREGETAHILMEEATRAGLVVVGARGRGGFAGLLLGSVATDLVHHCPCPIAVVPHGRANRERDR